MTVRTALILIAVLLLPAHAVSAEFVARHGLTSGQYQSAFDKYVGQGYVLTSVDAYPSPRGMLYAAIWQRKGSPRWVARHGMSAAQYQAAFDTYSAQGYRPLDISAAGFGQGPGTFAAVWAKSPGAWVARHGLTSQGYQAEFDKWTGQGYRLVDVEGYTTQGGVVRYAAVWLRRQGPAWIARHGLSSGRYQSAFNDAVAKGYRLTHVDGYWTPAGVRYAAIWERRQGPAWVARHGLSSAQYQSEFNKYVGQGYRLVHVSGYTDGGRDLYAAIWSR